ncbi:hypothetical protein ACFYMW_35720 [Streptomyces sp. NPDC006692]|uniref:hypothetical protein n=1 Tax=unclassified Streptomyces TaxID=2593676 RepID=UPI00341EC9D7
MNDVMNPAQQAAARARIAADVARARFAAPATIPVLRLVADHLDAAATAFESYDGTTNATFATAISGLASVQDLIARHPDTRIPGFALDYIEAPLTSAPLPELPPLNPVTARLAAEESVLRTELERLHADTFAATADTDRWFRNVLAVLAKWMRLAGVVGVDNARPCNRQPGPAATAEPAPQY